MLSGKTGLYIMCIMVLVLAPFLSVSHAETRSHSNGHQHAQTDAATKINHHERTAVSFGLDLAATQEMLAADDDTMCPEGDCCSDCAAKMPNGQSQCDGGGCEMFSVSIQGLLDGTPSDNTAPSTELAAVGNYDPVLSPGPAPLKRPPRA